HRLLQARGGGGARGRERPAVGRGGEARADDLAPDPLRGGARGLGGGHGPGDVREHRTGDEAGREVEALAVRTLVEVKVALAVGEEAVEVSVDVGALLVGVVVA